MAHLRRGSAGGWPQLARVMLLLLLLSFGPLLHAQSEEQSEESEWGAPKDRAARSLYRIWAKAYGLGKVDPPATLILSHSNGSSSREALKGLRVPRAPHLVDCAAYSKSHEAQKRKALGALAMDSGRGAGPPGLCTVWRRRLLHAPWIPPELSSASHVAQACLLANQLSPSCSLPSSTRLLLLTLGTPGSSTASLSRTLKDLAVALGLAAQMGRVLVPVHVSPSSGDPKAAPPVPGPECKGRAQSSLFCWLLPLSPPPCSSLALSLLQQGLVTTLSPSLLQGLSAAALVSSTLDKQALLLDLALPTTTPLLLSSASQLARSWLLLASSLPPNSTSAVAAQLQGRAVRSCAAGEDRACWRWWFPQALRFLLRYHTPRLCHALNHIRHAAIGRPVAAAVSQAQLSMTEAALKKQKLAAHEVKAMDKSFGNWMAAQGLDGGATLSVWSSPTSPPFFPSPSLALLPGSFYRRAVSARRSSINGGPMVQGLHRGMLEASRAETGVADAPASAREDVMQMLLQSEVLRARNPDLAFALVPPFPGAEMILRALARMKEWAIVQDKLPTLKIAPLGPPPQSTALAFVLLAAECDYVVSSKQSREAILVYALRQTKGV